DEPAALHRVLEAVPELVAVVPDEGPVVRRQDPHGAMKYEWPPGGGHSLSLKRGLRWAVVLRWVATRVAALARRAGSVVLERRPEPPRDRPLQDLPEHVAGPHAADRGVD